MCFFTNLTVQFSSVIWLEKLWVRQWEGLSHIWNGFFFKKKNGLTPPSSSPWYQHIPRKNHGKSLHHPSRHGFLQIHLEELSDSKFQWPVLGRHFQGGWTVFFFSWDGLMLPLNDLFDIKYANNGMNICFYGMLGSWKEKKTHRFIKQQMF